MNETHVDARNKALVGGALPEHFISLEIMSNNEIKDKLSDIKYNNAIEKAEEENFDVTRFNHHVL